MLGIARVLQVNVNSLVTRRFRHKDGFSDGTDYLEIIENGECVLHLIGGTVRKVGSLYSLKNCLDFVKKNKWIEL